MATNPYDLTDDECSALMRALDECDHDLSDRDVDFVASNLGRSSFSEKQKQWCASLIDRYGRHLPPDWRTFYAKGPKRTSEDELIGAALG